jgi:hypothetical protein
MVTKHLLTPLESSQLNSNQNQTHFPIHMQYGHLCHSQSDAHFEPLVFFFPLLNFVKPFHLIQDNIKHYNFAQNHHPKFITNLKWEASKVGTFSHKQDHMQNVILHIKSILTTTTTKMLHLIYEYNPPKRISKFRK